MRNTAKAPERIPAPIETNHSRGAGGQPPRSVIKKNTIPPIVRKARIAGPIGLFFMGEVSSFRKV
jgi:hypothetical protein